MNQCILAFAMLVSCFLLLMTALQERSTYKTPGSRELFAGPPEEVTAYPERPRKIYGDITPQHCANNDICDHSSSVTHVNETQGTHSVTVDYVA